MVTLNQIKQIEEEAKIKIEALREEARHEVVQLIAAKKEELAELEQKYIEITGKNFKGEMATPASGHRGGRRSRISADERKALASTLVGIIKSAKTGCAMGTMLSRTGLSSNIIRDVLKTIPGLTKTGRLSGTLYFIKDY